MVFTRTEPGAGEPESIIAAGYERGTRAHEIRTGVLGGLSGAKNRISGSEWQGDGANAYQGSLETVITQVEPLATELEAEAFALVKYGNQVETIKSKAQALQSSIDNATDELMELQKQDSLLGPETPPSLSPSKPPPADDSALFRDILTQSIETKQGELRAFDAQWDTLYNERVAADNEFVAALTGSGVRGGLGGMPAGGPATLNLDALLSLLSSLNQAELTALLAVYPGLGDQLVGADPEKVAEWWFGYSDAANPLQPTPAQLALIAAIPAVIGNLEGVAYWARDMANRIVLEDALANPLGTDNQPALQEILNSLQSAAGEPPRQLISLSGVQEGRPLAAVSIGDLDLAVFTTFQVSGMNSSTYDMVGAAQQALDLYREQQVLAFATGVEGPLAVIAWIGYQSPSTFTVTSMDAAEAGAENLENALKGYQATNPFSGVGDPYVSVEAHSYGSTTAMLALSQNDDLGVDALAMYGSAGAPPGVDSASDLHVPEGSVYVGQTVDDPWAPIGKSLSGRGNPSAWDDVNLYGTDGGNVDPITLEPLKEAHGHSEYLRPNTESQRNLAIIGLGEGVSVTEGKPYVANYTRHAN
jgi:hypothetical protein